MTKRGYYRHFKGKLYKLIDIAMQTETGEELVVYQALYGEMKVWARPLGMWNENVERDGKVMPRFEYIGETLPITLNEYMTIGSHCQGGAAWGRYYYQMQNANEEVRIVDLEAKTYKTVQMPNPDKLYHCNAAAFADGETLYVSNENILRHNCIVYKVGGDTLTPVQTITFDAPASVNRYYPNIALDAENKKLICISLQLPTPETHWSETTGITVDVYDLPGLCADNVELHVNEATNSFVLPPIVAPQGSCVYDGKIYLMSGNEIKTGILCHIIDYISGKELLTLDLGRSGVLRHEPESIFVYDGRFYITDVYGKIYGVCGFPQ